MKELSTWKVDVSKVSGGCHGAYRTCMHHTIIEDYVECHTNPNCRAEQSDKILALAQLLFGVTQFLVGGVACIWLAYNIGDTYTSCLFKLINTFRQTETGHPTAGLLITGKIRTKAHSIESDSSAQIMAKRAIVNV